MSVLSQLHKYLQLPQVAEQAQRLFHGRGHAYQDLHHITIDWLPPVALITLFAPVALSEIEACADYLLSALPDCSSVQLQHRYQLSGPIDIIRGERIKQLSITKIIYSLISV